MTTLHRSKRVLLDDGSMVEAGVLVAADGTIERVLKAGQQPPPDCNVQDYGDLLLMAGLVDSHVHLNEPGRTHWEGFHSGTRAAAAGGVTTVVDMPLNSLPPTTTVGNLATKRAAAEGQCHVDVAFWGGLVPDNVGDLRGLVAEGVVGFKCFLVESGVPEFPAVDERVAALALQELKESARPLLFHAECELKPEQEDDGQGCSSGQPNAYSTFLASRPAAMEVGAVELVARLCEKYRSPCHVVHLSAAEALPVIVDAKKRGAPLTVETCPHYLGLTAEEVPQGATHFKCCPPVRGTSNREALWDGVLAGHIQQVVSDHSPCTPELKRLDEGDFMAAWGGISSLQFGLAITWSTGRSRGLRLEDLPRLMSLAPAQLCGLHKRKGRLAPGYDADLVVWDPDEEFEVEESMIHHRHKVTPYLGRSLRGRVHYTILRGQVVFERGTFSPPRGVLLRAHQ